MRLIQITLCMILAVIFLISAVPKLLRPKSFVLVVVEYQILPLHLSQFYGRALPILEVLLAFMFLSGTDVRLSAIVSSSLLFSFIVAVSINMARGNNLSCNCFGSNRQRKIGWPLLLQDGLLLCAAITLVFLVPYWERLEFWSIFRLLSPASNIFPVLICIGCACGLTILLRRQVLLKA